MTTLWPASTNHILKETVPLIMFQTLPSITPWSSNELCVCEPWQGGLCSPAVVALLSRQQLTWVIKCEGCEEQTAINLPNTGHHHCLQRTEGTMCMCVCEWEWMPGHSGGSCICVFYSCQMNRVDHACLLVPVCRQECCVHINVHFYLSVCSGAWFV